MIEHAFGRGAAFSVGVEEELLLVEPPDYALAHSSSALLERLQLDERVARHDLYEAQIELSSRPSENAADAVRQLSELREAVRSAGATVIGSGIHPASRFGDVRLVDAERYAREAERLRGLVARTPDCALHVHVGMPDPETAIKVCNGLRNWMPMLEALSANSPFWHGSDSGFGSARRILRRGFPRVDIPPAFHDYAHYEEVVETVLEAGELDDYTFIWWEVRLQPKFGTVEVRAMDSQSSLATIAGLAVLVQGLAARLADDEAEEIVLREALSESSFRAGRDGLDATLYHREALRPVREVVAEAVALARAALGAEPALDEIDRILRGGNGADRQRAAHANGGILEVLELLVAETGRD
jgi:glutamate---cysteine ligase / carboxylate-amine ligase